MPGADWNVLKKYSLPKPSDGLLAVFNDTVRPITAQCLLADISARDFAKRDVMEYLAPFAVQSALMPANLITLAHFSVSSAMTFPKSAAHPANTARPSSASRDFILRSARAALTSLLSMSRISTGVPLGAHTPFHTLAS